MSVKTVNPLGIPLSVVPPQGPLAAAANTILLVYDKTAEPKLARITVHNLAATAVKYCMNSSKTAGAPDANAFHDILAGGNAEDDGIGSVVNIDCRDLNLLNLVFFHETNATRIAVTKFYDPYYN